jgi:DNA polymerase-1
MATTPTTLLIDGDVFAYKAATLSENPVHWGDGHWTLHAYESEGQEMIDGWILALMDRFDTTRYKVALSSPTNFRKTILPTYKANRAHVRKPLTLGPLRDYMVDKHGAKIVPGLEGDDVLGIWATHPKIVEGKKIICSIDKDMASVPGYLFVQGKMEEEVEITPAEADLWHLTQTLTGDATDGYTGCPGIGAVKARKELEKDPTWNTVVRLYEKQGRTEGEALVQARVARILRHSDYDFKKKEPKLWTPTQNL